MNILVDTNVLARAAQVSHPLRQIAADAVEGLRLRGEVLHLVPQNLYELWVVCTRPLSANGLGLALPQAAAELQRVRAFFKLVGDDVPVLDEWTRLVVRHQVLGKNAHDARLVAAMIVHGLGHLLTFNGGDFTRYPGITVLDPGDVVSGRA